ncbi:MAG: zinc ribbon domain-containing protein [Proteobacteria bacterium]|nr:zinc ribbon domain-containing protein [Pseudomonadota bacterium]
MHSSGRASGSPLTFNVEKYPMRSFGFLLFIAALVVLTFGFMYDTSVATGMGSRVHNVGLMNEKQNIIIAGGAMLVAGALLLALSTRNQFSTSANSPGYRTCPSCAEVVKDEAKVCRYCQRDLPSVSELRIAHEAEQQRLADARMLEGEAARQAEESLPKGSCPNCNKTIPLASQECKHCRASFGAGSAWRILPHCDA